jgi:hypothetical protein
MSQICPLCGKGNVKRMFSHFKNSHPGVDPATINKVKPEPEPSTDTAPEDDTPSVHETRPEPSAPDYGDVISKLIQANGALMEQVAAQQKALEDMTTKQGEFQKAVIEEMNKMPVLAKQVVTSTLDQLMAEAQAKAQGEGDGANQLTEVPGAAPQRPSGRSAMVEQFLPFLAQMLTGGNKPAGGDLLSQITTLKAIAEAFNPMPNILAGMNMATTMFSASARAGISPQDAARGSEHLIDQLSPKKPGA